MRTYSGHRDNDTCRVYVKEYGIRRLLPPRLDLVNHSPDGFSWGYFGSGPAQLAFALLFDVTRDRGLAERLHQRFKDSIVSRWHIDDEWSLTKADVEKWLLENNV